MRKEVEDFSLLLALILSLVLFSYVGAFGLRVVCLFCAFCCRSVCVCVIYFPFSLFNSVVHALCSCVGAFWLAFVRLLRVVASGVCCLLFALLDSVVYAFALFFDAGVVVLAFICVCAFLCKTYLCACF